MEKIKAAIVGYGNIGQYALEAINAAQDFELVGVVRRQAGEQQPKELEGCFAVSAYPIGGGSCKEVPGAGNQYSRQL